MISMKRTVAILAAAATMMAQPMSVLAATPGDNLLDKSGNVFGGGYVATCNGR